MKVLNTTKTALLLLCATSLQPALADDWEFTLNPYLQATNIEGNAGVGRADTRPVDVDFDTILDTLDTGAMLNFKAMHNSGWGFAVDYAFMDLKSDLAGPRDSIAKAGVRQGVLQLEAIYSQQKKHGQLDYLVGLRWWDNDLDLDVVMPGLDATQQIRVDEDWVDYFIGARWVAPINENWKYAVRGDIGTGGSDFTSSVEAGVQYHFNDNHSLEFKYKATFVDHEDGEYGEVDYFKYNTTTHGPVIGYSFKF